MNAIKAVLVGAAAAGVFLTGAQVAVAAPTTSASAEASAEVTGEVVAIVGKTLKVRVDASTVVNVDTDLKTIITGEVKVGANVNVNGKKVDAKILASAVVVIK